MRWLVLSALLAFAAGCDSDGRTPAYSGPSDYAYTLRVSCFCVYTGPIRVTVEDGTVVEAEALEDLQGTPQSVIDDIALTLSELSALAARAEREADAVTVRYDPAYGFPTELSIDWITEASDDEVWYTASDFEAR